MIQNRSLHDRPFIFLPPIDYQSLFQRSQHFAKGLAQRGYEVHFRNVGQVSGREPIVIDGVNVYQDFDKCPKIDNGIYIVSHPAFMGYKNWVMDDYVIYDCVDDFPDFQPHQENACRSANLVSYTTDKIKENLGCLLDGKEIIGLPNGVGNHFGVNNITTREMDDIASKYKIVIGFIGAFYHEWVDVELFEKLALEHPEWAMVIIGNTYNWNSTRTGNLPNLIHLGTKPHEFLDRYCHGLDIGLIPFLDNDISNGANPIKLYEYAACGIPVVGRNLAFSKDLHVPIYYGYDDYNECVNMIWGALFNNGDEHRAWRTKFAMDNTWDKRIYALLEKISETIK